MTNLRSSGIRLFAASFPLFACLAAREFWLRRSPATAERIAAAYAAALLLSACFFLGELADAKWHTRVNRSLPLFCVFLASVVSLSQFGLNPSSVLSLAFLVVGVFSCSWVLGLLTDRRQAN